MGRLWALVRHLVATKAPRSRSHLKGKTVEAHRRPPHTMRAAHALAKTALTAVATTLMVTFMYTIGYRAGSQLKVPATFDLQPAKSGDEVWLDSRDFLRVDNILNDPRTSSHPLQLKADEVESDDTRVRPKDSAIKTTRDLFEDRWTRTVASEACPQSRGHRPVTLSVVISAPSHFAERSAIRQTWGRQAARLKGSRIVYLTGLPAADPGDPVLLRDLVAESDLHRDVAISNNVDTYKNLTLKTLAAFRWAQTFCPQADFVLKTDDDMFVQVRRLLATVQGVRRGRPGNLRGSSGAGGPVILGNVASGWQPVRNPQSKYFITPEQYAGSTYPAFATGPSYLVSRAAVDLIVPAALDRPFFHLEDVFLTGIVAEEVGVPRSLATEFRNNAVPIPPQFVGCTLLRTISIHKVSPEQQRQYLEAATHPRCGPTSKVIDENGKKHQ